MNNIVKEFLNDLDDIIKDAKRKNWSFSKIVDEINKRIDRY